MWPPVPDIRAALGVSGACRRLRLFWESTNSGPPKLPLLPSLLGNPDKELAAFSALLVTPLGHALKYHKSSLLGLCWRCPGFSHAERRHKCHPLSHKALGLGYTSPSLYGSALNLPIPSLARHLTFSNGWLWGLENAYHGAVLRMAGWLAASLTSVPSSDN